MNLDRYRELLTAVESELARIGDLNGKRIFSRWIAALDGLTEAQHPNLKLRKQVGEVQRRSQAVGILAIERYVTPTALDRGQSDLEHAIAELLHEATGIAQKLDHADQILADRGLPEIVGEFLSSVVFVMDYVQLDFCGGTLTADTLPEVREEGAVYRPGQSGYRDALCRRIGVIITKVDVNTDEDIALYFVDNSSIHVSLRAEDQAGPESASFSSTVGGFWVW